MRLNNFQNKRVERDVLQFLQFSVDYVRLTNDILFCSCKVYFNYELVVVNKAIVCFRFPTAEIIQFKYIYITYLQPSLLFILQYTETTRCPIRLVSQRNKQTFLQS